jgi:hypothetical protein
MPERGKAAQPWARGTVRLRSDGRYEGREPSEKIPPAEKSRSVYSRTECKAELSAKKSASSGNCGASGKTVTRSTPSLGVHKFIAT